MIDISYYVNKVYPYPPCWALVAEYYCKEFGLDLVANFGFSSTHVEPYAKALRTALHSDNVKLVQVDTFQDSDIILLSKSEAAVSTRPHCGIVVGNSVLHATEEGNFVENIYSIKDVFLYQEVWRLCR